MPFNEFGNTEEEPVSLRRMKEFEEFGFGYVMFGYLWWL